MHALFKKTSIKMLAYYLNETDSCLPIFATCTNKTVLSVLNEKGNVFLVFVIKHQKQLKYVKVHEDLKPEEITDIYR